MKQRIFSLLLAFVAGAGMLFADGSMPHQTADGNMLLQKNLSEDVRRPLSLKRNQVKFSAAGQKQRGRAVFRFSVIERTDADHTAVRVCTDWATTEENVTLLINAL